MKLYSYWRSSSAHRVRIGLHLKGLEFTYVAVNLATGEQFEAAHRRRSPGSKVPALELDDGHIITESMAILEYLEEVYPQPPLLPSDPYRRARTRMLAELVNSGIQPLQNTSVARQVKEVLRQDDAMWRIHWIGAGLATLEAAVEESAGLFCVGDAPTLADVMLVPQLYAARRFGVDVSSLSTLLRIEAACNELPGFQAAHPDQQPDAQK